MRFDKIIQPIVKDFGSVDELLLKNLDSRLPFINEVARYIINNGGKRLRPLVSLLIAKALGYEGDKHITIGCTLEILHTATLLHDDVVDESDLRRKKPAVHVVWGNAAAVLVGDFLISRTFELSVSTGNLRVMQVLAETTNVIAEGEVMQLLSRNNAEVNREDYDKIIYCKTAKLFECAGQAAVILASGTEAQEQAGRDFGKYLGIAFQLVDDVLDYIGDSETLGKNVGDDLAEGKPTMPLIYALEQATEEERSRLTQIIEQGEVEKIDDVLAIIKKYKALEYTQEMARDYIAKAKECLHIIAHQDNQYIKTLMQLSDFSIQRIS